jgi:hypothetical protein
MAVGSCMFDLRAGINDDTRLRKDCVEDDREMRVVRDPRVESSFVSSSSDILGRLCVDSVLAGVADTTPTLPSGRVIVNLPLLPINDTRASEGRLGLFSPALVKLLALPLRRI